MFGVYGTARTQISDVSVLEVELTVTYAYVCVCVYIS